MARTIASKATMYGGTRFRSRLEARWAAYFDGIKLVWEYEPKTFCVNLKNGESVFYIPDFWLPALKTWIEVKPVPFGTWDAPNDILPDEEFRKISLFYEDFQIRGEKKPLFFVTNGAPNFVKMVEGDQFYGFHGSDNFYDPLEVVCGRCAKCLMPNLTMGHWDCIYCKEGLSFLGSEIKQLCSRVKDMKFEDARD